MECFFTAVAAFEYLDESYGVNGTVTPATPAASTNGSVLWDNGEFDITAFLSVVWRFGLSAPDNLLQ